MDLCSLARSFSALSDPIRLRLLATLRTNPATCSKELAESLGISVALASHHTKILEDASLIIRRREGQFSKFSLNHEVMNAIATTLGAAACVKTPEDSCEEAGAPG